MNTFMANRTGTMAIVPSARVEMAITQLYLMTEHHQFHGSIIPELFVTHVVKSWIIPGENYNWFRNAVVTKWNIFVASKKA